VRLRASYRPEVNNACTRSTTLEAWRSVHGVELRQSIEFRMSLRLFAALASYLPASPVTGPMAIGEIWVGSAIGPDFLGRII
jgi:hypothetical protein